MRASFAALAATALLAALLAGCGSSSTATVTHVTVETVTRTDTVTVPPAASTRTATTAAPPTTSTATADVPACVAADLSPSFLGSNGATGHVVLSFALRNRSKTACRTYGWPGLQFLAGDGKPVATDTQRTTSDLLGSSPAVPLTLAAGQEASFRVIVADMGAGGGNQGCATAAAVQIIAPDDTATMAVQLTAPVTECGQATLSPLLAGSDAVPGV